MNNFRKDPGCPACASTILERKHVQRLARHTASNKALTVVEADIYWCISCNLPVLFGTSTEESVQEMLATLAQERGVDLSSLQAKDVEVEVTPQGKRPKLLGQRRHIAGLPVIDTAKPIVEK